MTVKEEREKKGCMPKDMHQDWRIFGVLEKERNWDMVVDAPVREGYGSGRPS